ncbi:hypothetical protein V5O48_007230 [Marasmius crinis-equi]|uniref:RRM domain-containing protein n=1 Tax=Marasmius crinis-equi TaxID=585013 RepID=A0ABR3FH84_9AGAR
MSVDNGSGRRADSRSGSPIREHRRGRDDPESANRGNNLHVRGLSRSVDSRLLEETFTQAGRVVKAEVMYDPQTRESRGFGFVTMESPEEAEAAIAALSGTQLSGRAITIEKLSGPMTLVHMTVATLVIILPDADVLVHARETEIMADAERGIMTTTTGGITEIGIEMKIEDTDGLTLSAIIQGATFVM